MDDIVKQAMLKWPNVPDCFGWLGLDQRGDWWLRDMPTQQQGPFMHSKGRRVEHPQLLGFIARNYAADAQGRWFFQNGPQRVYVELENTPIVWRVHAGGAVHAHVAIGGVTAAAAQVQQGLLDEQGRLYLVCDGVLGVVHSQDMVYAAEQIEAAAWPLLQDVQQFADLPAAWGFVRSPWLEQGALK